MRRPDLLRLKRTVEKTPKLSRFVRLSSASVRLGRQWIPIREVRNLEDSVEIIGRNHGRLKVPVDVWREEKREEHLRVILKALQQSLGPFQLLSRRDRTSRMHGQAASTIRLIVRRRNKRMAVVAVPPDRPPSLASRLLGSAVLWWDRIRRIGRMVLLVPHTWAEELLEPLEEFRIPAEYIRYRSDGSVVSRRKAGEEGDRISPFQIYPLSSLVPELLLRLSSDLPELDLLFRRDRWEVSCRGLPVVWQGDADRLLFDYLRPRPLSVDGSDELEEHLERVTRERIYPPPRPSSPYYRFGRELWLESEVVRQRSLIDPEMTGPLYCQVPTWVQGERRVIDLLSCRRDGRLVVIELKTTRRMALIFQALEYGLRVEKHCRNGEFPAAGYFPAQRLKKEFPVVYLISPLFEFHRSMPTVRRYLSPRIQFDCIGLNSDWQRGIRILRRFQL